MPQIYKNLCIDVFKPNTFAYPVAKQRDAASRFLKIRLENFGTPITIEIGNTVLLNAEKPDGNQTCTEGSVNGDGTVTVEHVLFRISIEYFFQFPFEAFLQHLTSRYLNFPYNNKC